MQDRKASILSGSGNRLVSFRSYPRPKTSTVICMDDVDRGLDLSSIDLLIPLVFDLSRHSKAYRQMF